MSRFRQTRAAILVAAMIAAGGGASQAATLTAQERANEQLVVDFYAALNSTDAAAHARSISEHFISPDYIQHSENNQGPGNARERFISAMEHIPSGPRPGFQAPAKTIALMADGDLVTLVTSREVPNGAGATRPVFIFNMFRIKDSRLAEHWDALPAALTGPGPAKR